MAARIAPQQRVQAAHQSLHHVVAQADWSDEAVLDVVRARVLPAMERHGPIQAWIVDDTGLPKEARHSVGVARQYCGPLGCAKRTQSVKLDKCQGAGEAVARQRPCRPAGSICARPGPTIRCAVRAPGCRRMSPSRASPRSIALDPIRVAVAADLPRGLVLSDAGYGNDTRFRDEVSALGLLYALGLLSSSLVWPPGLEPQPARGPGRVPMRRRRDADHRPVSVKPNFHSQ